VAKLWGLEAMEKKNLKAEAKVEGEKVDLLQ